LTDHHDSTVTLSLSKGWIPSSDLIGGSSRGMTDYANHTLWTDSNYLHIFFIFCSSLIHIFPLLLNIDDNFLHLWAAGTLLPAAPSKYHGVLNPKQVHSDRLRWTASRVRKYVIRDRYVENRATLLILFYSKRTRITDTDYGFSIICYNLSDSFVISLNYS